MDEGVFWCNATQEPCSGLSETLEGLPEDEMED